MSTLGAPLVPYPERMRPDLRNAWTLGAFEGYAGFRMKAQGKMTDEELEALSARTIARLEWVELGAYCEAYDAGWSRASREEEL